MKEFVATKEIMQKRYILFIEEDKLVKFWDKKDSQMRVIRNESIVNMKGSFSMHIKFHPYAKIIETNEKPKV